MWLQVTEIPGDPNGLIISGIGIIMVIILLLVFVAVYFLKSIHTDFKNLRDTVQAILQRQARIETSDENIKARLDSHADKIKNLYDKVSSK